MPESVFLSGKGTSTVPCLARSSPASGAKNLHRRVFYFRQFFPNNLPRAVVFFAPNLARQGKSMSKKPERIRHTQALWTQKRIIETIVRTNDCLNNLIIWQAIVCTICCHNNLLSRLSVVKTNYRQNKLLIVRHLDLSNYQTIELSID